MNEFTEYLMRSALDEAYKAFQKNEVPIGCVIALDNKIISSAHNQVETNQDATSHAEILAIRNASQTINNWRLNNATLCVTAEPCIMCLGAVLNSRISKIVYGVDVPRTGGIVSNIGVDLGGIVIESGVKKENCLELLQEFFKTRRDAVKD